MIRIGTCCHCGVRAAVWGVRGACVADTCQAADDGIDLLEAWRRPRGRDGRFLKAAA